MKCELCGYEADELYIAQFIDGHEDPPHELKVCSSCYPHDEDYITPRQIIKEKNERSYQ